MDLKKLNIDNLTSLWQLVNRKADTYVIGNTFDYGAIAYSDWPNKLWFINSPKQSDIDAIKKIIASSPIKITVPHWEIEGKEYESLLIANGFEKVLEQVGMVLDLSKEVSTPSRLKLQRVENKDAAQLWESLFEKAFNYKIHHELILKSLDEIEYLIAYYGTSPVGTALTYNTGKEIVGIHSMGIIPEMRRKGYAEKMMHSMLYEAVKKGYSHATLQASAMGKGLYKKLGFEEQFSMSNYALVK
ncbi:MAG: GNAT family N-acetyltransferase [Bacteroidota bacterium]